MSKMHRGILAVWPDITPEVAAWPPANPSSCFRKGAAALGSASCLSAPGPLAAACAPDSAPVTVQPVSIVYGPQTADRPGLTRAESDRYAWYGHMKMLPHLWRLFGSPEKLTVAVQYHALRRSDEFESSRALAQWAVLRARHTQVTAC